MSPDATRHGVVRSAWVPGRRTPEHAAEMVTQWVCGEVLEIEERDGGWRRVRGPDGYGCWVDGGGLLPVGPAEAEAWREAAGAVSLGTELAPAGDGPGGGEGPGRERSSPAFLPWGARVRRLGGGTVGLPDGAVARPLSPEALVREEERAERFPPRPGPLLETAGRWVGVPYVWGGRTRAGADCSGFLQAVFALHGVSLPRDSAEQLAAGPAARADGQRRPGDLLFFGRDAEGIGHVALAVGGSRILHAAAPNGAVAHDDLSEEEGLGAELRATLRAVTRPLPERDPR